MTDLLRLAGTVELTAGDGTKQPRITIVAYSGGAMQIPGFGLTVIDLAGMSWLPTIPILIDHEVTLAATIGTGTPTIRKNILEVEGIVSLASPTGKQVVEMSREGITFAASVGVAPEQTTFVRAGDSVRVNGRDITAPRNGLRMVGKGALKEVSLVPVGADSTTSVSIAARAGKRGNQMSEHETPDPIAAERARIEKVEKEIGHLEKNFAHNPAGLERVATLRGAAISGHIVGAEYDAAYVELLRDSRPDIGRRHSGPSIAGSDVLEASICLTSGLPEQFVGKHFAPNVMNAALSSQFRGAGIHAAMMTTIRAAGLEPRGHRINEQTIKLAFEADRQLRASGFSSISLPGILGNVANKTLLQSYASVPTTWQTFCATESNSDFKAHSRYRLTGLGAFEQVGPTGEIKHISLNEQTYSNTLGTYGAMIALSRQDIINDDISALTQGPAVMGRMSAIAIDKAVYTKLLANPSSFFHSSYSNLLTGAGSALAILGLTTAEAAFLNLLDDNGDPVLIQPSVLLVPTALATTAAALVSSVKIVATTTTNVGIPDGNVFAGKYVPVVSPWLGLSTLTGYSIAAWYLLSGPGPTAIMEVAFLDGKTTPTIESGDTDFATLGMQWRAYMDFGVAMRDYRGGIKNAGS